MPRVLPDAAQFQATTGLEGDVPLVVDMRGEFAESIHRGSVAVTDEHGHLQWAAGSPYARTFMRSGAKPFQALPAVLAGAVDRFGFTQAETAVLCSSHTGEPRHERAVLSVLQKIGLDEGYLQCGTHAPLNRRAAAARSARGLQPSAVCNNCSGAHAAMLTACVANRWSLHDYIAAHHPLQRLIHSLLATFAGLPGEEIETATDNCMVPTFRLPLFASATAFARLATSGDLTDAHARAAETVRSAMISCPEMVGGEDRFDTVLMAAAGGTLVAKGGARGFQGIGALAARLGVALKISDGDDSAAATAATSVVDQVLASGSTWDALTPFRERYILTATGAVAGTHHAVFSLERAR